MNHYHFTTAELKELTESIIEEHYKARARYWKKNGCKIEPTKLDLSVETLTKAVKKYKV